MAVKRRYCLAAELKDDPLLIEEYKRYHAPGQAWPEITDSIKSAGIEELEIFIVGNRLFMIMEVNDHFDFEEKAIADEESAKVQEWEALMWKYQVPMKWAKPGEKWLMTELIYKLPA